MSTPTNREALLAMGGQREYAETEIGDRKFRCQSLTEAEMCHVEAALVDRSGKGVNLDNYHLRRARLLVLSLVDKDGERLFADGEEDVVQGLEARLVRQLYDFAIEHCDMKAKPSSTTVEDAEKN